MKLRIYSSASIAANSLLYVRPSSWCFELKVYVHQDRVCPGSVGTRQALLQGWLCVSALCALQMCLTWCVGLYFFLSILKPLSFRKSFMSMGFTPCFFATAGILLGLVLFSFVIKTQLCTLQ
jgi:hypothetical protein